MLLVRNCDDVVEVMVSKNTAVGQSLAIITAADRDVGDNALIHYSVRRCTPFEMTSLVVTSLNSTSAAITSAASFDYDSPVSYQCLIAVCDSGSVTSLCADDVIVTVHVTEVLKQRPLFDKSGGYHFTVRENQPAGTFVGTCSKY